VRFQCLHALNVTNTQSDNAANDGAMATSHLTYLCTSGLNATITLSLIDASCGSFYSRINALVCRKNCESLDNVCQTSALLTWVSSAVKGVVSMSVLYLRGSTHLVEQYSTSTAARCVSARSLMSEFVRLLHAWKLTRCRVGRHKFTMSQVRSTTTTSALT